MRIIDKNKTGDYNIAGTFRLTVFRNLRWKTASGQCFRMSICLINECYTRINLRKDDQITPARTLQATGPQLKSVNAREVTVLPMPKPYIAIMVVQGDLARNSAACLCHRMSETNPLRSWQK